MQMIQICGKHTQKIGVIKNSMFKKYDVIVIGAGPAGCTAAKRLAENGFHVLLVEKLKLPREKSCSGILIQKSMTLVKQYYGKDIPLSAMCTPIENRGMIFTDSHGKEFRFEQEGRNIWRSVFDHWLAQQAVMAGAALLDDTMVTGCIESPGLVTVTMHKEGTSSFGAAAECVIDCEGVVGRLKRQLMKIEPSYIKTYQVFYEGISSLDPHYFYAYLQPEFSGYDAWFNVKDDMPVLGVSMPAADSVKTDSVIRTGADEAAICAYYQRFLSYMKENHGLCLKKKIREERWLMPQIKPGCPIDLGRGRVFFAGEAAGFLNPMGEGISAGMESGACIADAIIQTHHFKEIDKIYEFYEKNSAALHQYMQRQWRFLGEISSAFSCMKQ